MSVRRSRARRGLGSSGKNIGLPQRVPIKTHLGDELDGIQELETTESGGRNENEQKLESRSEELQVIKEVETVEPMEIKENDQKIESKAEGFKAIKEMDRKECVEINENEQKMEIGEEFQPVGCLQDSLRPEPANSTSHQDRSLNHKTKEQQCVPASHSGPVNWSGHLSHSDHVSNGTFIPGNPPQVQIGGSRVSAHSVSQETLIVNRKVYQKLETIGRGGSSKVCQSPCAYSVNL